LPATTVWVPQIPEIGHHTGGLIDEWNGIVCRLNVIGEPFDIFLRLIINTAEAVTYRLSLNNPYCHSEELAAGSLPGDQDSTPTSKKKGINLYLLMGGASVLLIIASVAFRARNPPDS